MSRVPDHEYRRDNPMLIRKFFRYLRRRRFQYQPLVRVLIHKNNLLYNLGVFRDFRPGLLVAPVLKSNAYGHGLVPIARILDKEDIAFIVVDSYYEALTLRNEGIKSKIIIIGFTPISNILKNGLKNVSFTISDIEVLRELSLNLRSPAVIHLKIDTGMNRQGILPEQIPEAVGLIGDNENTVLEGVCSHLADAKNKNSAYTFSQIKVWNNASEILKKWIPNIKYFHLAATDGAVYSDRIRANVLRIGIGLYGISDALPGLKPVLELKSVIGSIKQTAENKFVGYGLTFKTAGPAKIAIVPVGYYEGIDRRLSNKGSLTCRENTCKIIGAVSMNITAIDTSGLTDLKIGDEVTIISSNKNDPNSLENIAKLCDTIPYEILVHISKQIRRIVI